MSVAVAAVALLITPGTALGAVGDILVSDTNAFGGGEGGVIAVNPATGARTLVSQNLAPTGAPYFFEPFGIAVAPAGDNAFVGDRDAHDGTGSAIGVALATGGRSLLSRNNAPAGGPNFDNPSGIAIAANGDVLIADDAAFGGSGGVIRVNPGTGARSAVSSNAAPAGGPNFADPRGIAIAPNGDLYVVDSGAFGAEPNGGVIRVNPVTGARTAISSNGAPSGGPTFVDPNGIAIAANGDLYIIDPTSFGGGGGVIRVNPTTGARSTLSANGAPGGGPDFAEPIGVAVAANRDLLIADQNAFGGGGGVIRVNSTTGARSAVSSNAAPAGGPTFADPTGIAVVTKVTSTMQMSCYTPTVRAGVDTNCTVTINGATHPSGTVNFSTNALGGAWNPGNKSCTLFLLGGNQGRCSIRYYPYSVGSGSHQITATYSGDAGSTPTQATANVTVLPATSNAAVSCNPTSMKARQTTSCLVTVTGPSSSPVPTGQVQFDRNQSGSFSSPACNLVTGTGGSSCSVAYTPAVAAEHKIYVGYTGDTDHYASYITTSITATVP